MNIDYEDDQYPWANKILAEEAGLKPYRVRSTPTIDASCEGIWRALAKRRKQTGDITGAAAAARGAQALRAASLVRSAQEKGWRTRTA